VEQSPEIEEEVALPPIYYRLERERVWWLPYVTPRPTWAIYYPKSYGKALGLLYRRPPPPELEGGITLGICVGLTTGEAYFSYGIGRDRYFPRIITKMMEEEPVKDFARNVGIKHHLLEKYKDVIDVWGCGVYGLRCVLLSTLMYPHITGKRKSMCRYFYEKGYAVTPREVREFAKKFRARRTIVRTSREEAGSEIIEEVVKVEPERSRF